jgi:hypothetical protein
MSDTASADRSDGKSLPPMDRTRTGHSIELWRLRSATGQLRGLACETSFGYALGFELDAELIALHPTLNLESLVAHAERIHTALIAHGWQPIPERGGRRTER